jgi:O-antigen/teichoic acid export membrane protein
LIFARRITRIRVKNTVAKRILKETFPYTASEFLAWTLMRVDILLLAALLGDQAVGIYSPAVSFANILFLVPAAIYTVILPVLSGLYSSNPHQAWLTALRSLGLLLVVGSALSIFIFWISPLLINILGESYHAATDLLKIMSLILVVHSLAFGMAAILVAVKQQSRRMIVQAIAVGVNIFLNLLVIPPYGVKGAAWVYVTTEVVLLAGYSGLVFQYWKKSRSPAVNQTQ